MIEKTITQFPIPGIHSDHDPREGKGSSRDTDTVGEFKNRSSGWADDRVNVWMKVGCHSNNNSQILREYRLPSVGYANG
jgi:hypothetical protein